MMRILGSGLAIILLCYIAYLIIKYFCILSIQAWAFLFFPGDEDIKIVNAQRVIAVALGVVVIPIACLKLGVMWMGVKE